MKVALVHDQLHEFGGAERVLLAMSEMWPDAPIYTAYLKVGSPAWERFKDKNIKTSFMNSMSDFASPLRFMAPLIWNSFDFRDFDVIISSSSWYINKGFRKKGKAIEICYCHTPPRWLYGYSTSKQHAVAKIYGTIVGFFMRHYDFEAAQGVDYFIANSNETASRIKKIYRRNSTVIYPPIDVSGITYNVLRSYFLIVSRLAQPKNIELAIRAANQLKFKLKIVGTGPDEERLKSIAGKTVEFLGFVSDEELPKLYAGAKAFLALSTDEDFGITPVEAMSVGTPVIAYRGGGYTESVVEGKTGMFFDDDLDTAIQKFKKLNFRSEDCINQAKKFSKDRFKKELMRFVSSKQPQTSV